LLEEGRVNIPIGLLIEKWLLYYYPILASGEQIPQINGDLKLAFQEQFRPVIRYYELHGGLSAFYNDMRNKGISPTIQADFIVLAKKLKDTITKMPMKYIGRSISDQYYSIFQYTSGSYKLHTPAVVDTNYLIDNFG